MSDAMIRNAIASSVVGLTKHVMAVQVKPDYEAYRLVSESQTYALLADPRSRLYLMTNAELCRLYDSETKGRLAEALGQ